MTNTREKRERLKIFNHVLASSYPKYRSNPTRDFRVVGFTRNVFWESGMFSVYPTNLTEFTCNRPNIFSSYTVTLSETTSGATRWEEGVLAIPDPLSSVDVN